MATKWFNDENYDIPPIMVNWGKDAVTISQADKSVVLTEKTIFALAEILCEIIENEARKGN